MGFRVLIIEDEQPARMRLEKLISGHLDEIELIGHAVNGQEGLEKINDLKPDLIFLDIQMPGLNGFEMLSRLEKVPLIIFCTAYDEYALQAFETNSIDYLLKPIKAERLKQSLEKLKRLQPGLNNRDIIHLIKSFERNETRNEVTSLTIRNGKKMLFLKLKDIMYFKAEDKYVNVYMHNGEHHLSEQSLQNLGKHVPDNFKKIHRSLIINTNYIKEVHSYFNSRFAFILGDRTHFKLISGRSFQQEIKGWMNV